MRLLVTNIFLMCQSWHLVMMLSIFYWPQTLVLSWSCRPCHTAVAPLSHRQIHPGGKYCKHANFNLKFCGSVTVYVNINNIHALLFICKNFYVLIPQNSGPGLVLAWSWALKCVAAPKSSRIQSTRRNSKYISVDLKIGVCIKCYVNFNIQSMFQCFSQH